MSVPEVCTDYIIMQLSNLRILYLIKELPEVLNDFLLDIKEKNALLLQCGKEKQQFLAQIYEQVQLVI